MTLHRFNRCKHCQQPYSYFISGINPQYNDNTYCPECMAIIAEALTHVPIKFHKKFIDTTDYTKEQIIETQNERCSNGPPVRRVMPGLFDLKDPDNKHNIVCEMMLDPILKIKLYYKAIWWSKKPDETTIHKEVWWDIEKNAIAQDQNDYRT